MASTLAFVAILGLCALMLWGSYKIEPHWVSKDARRLVCYGQGMSNRGEPYGRWRELRLTIMGNGTVEVRIRHGTLAKDRHTDGTRMASVSPFARGTFKRGVKRVSYWRVNGASPDPPPRRIVYLLDGNDDPTMPELLAIRLPARSRAIPMLEELAINKSKLVTDLMASGRKSPTYPGTQQPEEQPDRG